jgi:hypothetical protein
VIRGERKGRVDGNYGGIVGFCHGDMKCFERETWAYDTSFELSDGD